MTEATRTTKRDRIVRDACTKLGITLSDAAAEMGWSPGNLHGALLSARPHSPTLEKIRVWLDRAGIRKRGGRPYSNEDLVG